LDFIRRLKANYIDVLKNCTRDYAMGGIDIGGLISYVETMAVLGSSPKTSHVRILVVDDRDLMRRCLRTLLEQREQWRVCSEAANGREAIEKAQQSLPDVIVLDFQMPEMNGLDAAREIRRRSPEIPILMVTLHLSPQLQYQASGSEYAERATKMMLAALSTRWTPSCTAAPTIEINTRRVG